MCWVCACACISASGLQITDMFTRMVTNVVGARLIMRADASSMQLRCCAPQHAAGAHGLRLHVCMQHDCMCACMRRIVAGPQLNAVRLLQVPRAPTCSTTRFPGSRLMSGTDVGSSKMMYWTSSSPAGEDMPIKHGLSMHALHGGTGAWSSQPWLRSMQAPLSQPTLHRHQLIQLVANGWLAHGPRCTFAAVPASTSDHTQFEQGAWDQSVFVLVKPRMLSNNNSGTSSGPPLPHPSWLQAWARPCRKLRV